MSIYKFADQFSITEPLYRNLQASASPSFSQTTALASGIWQIVDENLIAIYRPGILVWAFILICVFLSG